MGIRAGLLVGGFAALVLAASVCLAFFDTTSESDDFQQLTGGLGFGPALDLSGCPFCFDPRASSACRVDQGPLIGGGCFCPYHSQAILHYQRLILEERHTEERDDAGLP